MSPPRIPFLALGGGLSTGGKSNQSLLQFLAETQKAEANLPVGADP